MTRKTTIKQNKKDKSQKSNLNTKKAIVITKNKTLAKRKANYVKEMQKLNGCTSKVNRNKLSSFEIDKKLPESFTAAFFSKIENCIKKDGNFVCLVFITK